jgi:hypothetical protein
MTCVIASSETLRKSNEEQLIWQMRSHAEGRTAAEIL